MINKSRPVSSPTKSSSFSFPKRHPVGCPGLRILFNQEIHHNQEVKFIQNQHLTDHKCHQAFLSHVHLAWSHCKSTFVWSFFAERSVFYPSTANLMRGLRFCPCVMWALLFHESQFAPVDDFKMDKKLIPDIQKLQSSLQPPTNLGDSLESVFTPGTASKL